MPEKKTLRGRPLGRPKRKWKISIKMELKKRRWIKLVQDRVKWQAFVLEVLNLRILPPESVRPQRNIGCEDGKWIKLDQDRAQWRGLVSEVLNLQVMLPQSYATSKEYSSDMKLLETDTVLGGPLKVPCVPHSTGVMVSPFTRDPESYRRHQNAEMKLVRVCRTRRRQQLSYNSAHIVTHRLLGPPTIQWAN
jgi:hypothetical protein